MKFGDRLYELRRQKGLSQEELANRIDVSRQTVSRWEIGDTVPDMDKLLAMGEVFEISLDELVKGIPAGNPKSRDVEMSQALKEKVLTPENKVKAQKGLKIVAIILGVALAIDVISFIIYFSLFGFPN
ncbi:MAG: helix-turn-helix domain-containing protein [Agathobacter sp.]|nr:helix-turn-helix domain-containing protein [Agathobacter sp.]